MMVRYQVSNNARLGAQQVCYRCEKTDRSWSPVIATAKILPGEEIFAPYGSLVTRENLSQEKPESKDDADLEETLPKCFVCGYLGLDPQTTRRRLVVYRLKIESNMS